jgi:hypothetical protein
MIKMRAIKPIECTEGRFLPNDEFEVEKESRANAFEQIGKAVRVKIEETKEDVKRNIEPGTKRGRRRRA